MDFIVLEESLESGDLVTLFSQPGYKGEEQTFKLGLYSRSQLIFPDVGSARLQPFVTLILYENADRSGAFVFLNEDDPALGAKVAFRPNLIAVIRHAGIYSGGELRGNLVPGEYKPGDVLKDVDTLRVPEGVRIKFWQETGAPDSRPAREIGVGDYPIDESMRQYAVMTVNLLSGANFLGDEVLSDEEMSLVSGGSCVVKGCAAQACAMDMGVIQVCAAQACGINVIPGLPVGP